VDLGCIVDFLINRLINHLANLLFSHIYLFRSYQGSRKNQNVWAHDAACDATPQGGVLLLLEVVSIQPGPSHRGAFYFFNHSQSTKNAIQCLAPFTCQKQKLSLDLF
jgi:hypothetical protein